LIGAKQVSVHDTRSIPIVVEMPAQQQQPQWADTDDLRTQFTLAMSDMYKQEVPLYGTLVRIVDNVNRSTLVGTLDSQIIAMRFGDVCCSRLNIERHGAIRVGTTDELRTISAVFRLLGLFPVGYYDLSQGEAGLPMHATCFRPVTRETLRKNPFRIFTSVLRPELIKGPEARQLAATILQRRKIFSPDLIAILEKASCQGGRLTIEQSATFVHEALKVFQWKGTTVATRAEYEVLRSQHPVLADVACFTSCHINHLTPRTLDITAAHRGMEEEGLQVKENIEGPPPRKCPILLRQTSFLAVEEVIHFSGQVEQPHGTTGLGSHRARFGEIEERGAAVTPSGRLLYDKLMIKACESFGKMMASRGKEIIQLGVRERYERNLAMVFAEYPDSWQELRRQRLVYFTYQCSKTSGTPSRSLSPTKWPIILLDELVEDGTLVALPITYEDFLPLSAAGIFRSNLDQSPAQNPNQTVNLTLDNPGSGDMTGLQDTIRCRIFDSDDLYKDMEAKSIAACSQILRIRINM
jgi:uncharacterized glyoxalase superfamily metalloenzyme YdcJ